MLNIVSTEVRHICECDSSFLIQIADGAEASDTIPGVTDTPIRDVLL
jgi:hypothetical protein